MLNKSLFVLGTVAATLASTALRAEPTAYPLTIENCGQSVTFDQAPEKAVALGQNSAEIMFLLGLEDRMAATAFWPTKVLPELEEANSKVEVLTVEFPTLESVLAKQPDFVAAMLVTLMGEDSKVAKRKDFDDLGIPTYLSPSACSTTKSATDVYGTRHELWTMDLVYKEIEDIARIFDVADRGQALIDGFKAREAALRANFADNEDLTFLFWFSSPSPSDDAYLAGGNGPSAYLADILGGSNALTIGMADARLGRHHGRRPDGDGRGPGRPQPLGSRQGRKQDRLPHHRSDCQPHAGREQGTHRHHRRGGDERRPARALRGRAARRAAQGLRPVAMTPEHSDAGAFRLALLLVACLGLLALAIAVATAIGDYSIGLGTVALAITNSLGLTGAEIPPIEQSVVWNLRLSRTLVAALAGAGLAISGAILQALLRNALAEPFVLGVSAGASTGAVSVIVLGVGAGSLSLSLGAFVGAFSAFAFVAILSNGATSGPNHTILAGVAASQLFNALTSYIVTTSGNAQQARDVMFWLLGSFGGVRWPDFQLLLIVVVVSLTVCIFMARALDAFTFGDEDAAALGVPVARIRLIMFAVTAILTVSMVGAIGFVGLVVPHAARYVVGPLHLRLLPACAAVGAIFMVCADIASRVIVAQQTVPIGVVTALVGVPFFAIILYRARPQS